MITNAGKSSLVVDARGVVKTRVGITRVVSFTAVDARPAKMTATDVQSFSLLTFSLQHHSLTRFNQNWGI